MINDPLTDEQEQLFEYLRSQQAASVFGCAGSGKTALAASLAAQLAQAGLKVLFLCHNPYLAESIARRLANTRVDVYAFADFIRSLHQSDQSPDVFVPRTPAGWQTPWTQYDAPSPGDLKRALDIVYRTAQFYEAVIIDEGQDFQAGWLEVAEASLSNADSSHFVIFFDDHPWLAPFGPQRMYADLRAPITLSRGCRSAGEIDSLVRSLHPARLQPGLLAEEKGIVREWVYAGEEGMFDSLRQAMLAAEEFSPSLKDVVVISAESTSSRLSKFSGLIVDSPRLRAAPSAGHLNWRIAVLGYLQGFGLLESMLSDRPAPAPEDVRRVSSFCSAYQTTHRRALSRQTSYSAKHSLAWHMDSYGSLRLRWVEAHDLDLPPVDVIKFFSRPGWAGSLPSAHKRYRLTTAEDWEGYPEHHRLQLADIPAFKGLEAEGVIFLLYNYFAQDDNDLRATLYLACSRARRLLHIVTPFSILDGSAHHG